MPESGQSTEWAGRGLETGTVATASSEATASVGGQQVYTNQSAPTKSKKNLLSPRLFLLILGTLAVAGFILVSVSRRSSAPPPDFQDLGAGISNATGLKGNLKTRWVSKAVQYKLELEPLDPLQSAGFSYVAANPPAPLSIHVKLLDRTGFAVCGKDILFPFDPANPGEGNRERGQDIFQTSLGDDGKVTAVTAQGTLPCTRAQYGQVDYWDFSTNFPTQTQQDELLQQSEQPKAPQEAQKRAALRRQKTRQKTQWSAFYVEGDDQVTGYDASRGELETEMGNFLVTGAAAQSTATAWAADGALFHYKCDQRSRCVLTGAGGRESLSVSELQ